MSYKKLPKEFYLQNCLKIAKELIGKVLVRKKGNITYSGIIVETEAYTGQTDAAAHSFRGKTERNKFMFSKGGIAYVYFTYGNHYCVNVVVEKENISHAVLIRALEPLDGAERMKKNRGTDNIYNLASGPGKLTEAFEIDMKLNGADLRGKELFISEYTGDNNTRDRKHIIEKSKRIGITKNADKLYRFYAANNPFVSGVNVKAILKNLK